MVKKIRGAGVAALNPLVGEGSDIMTRMMASIIAKEKRLPVPVTAVNRPGGSSAVANAYVAGKTC